MPQQTDLVPLLGPSLQAAIERAIATVPADSHGTVKLRITLQGVEAEAAVRIMRGLEASAIYQRGRDGAQSFGGELRWTF